jgi:hypothetical protein
LGAGRAEREPVHRAIEPIADDLARPSRIMPSEPSDAGLLRIAVIDVPDATEDEIADRADCRDIRIRRRHPAAERGGQPVPPALPRGRGR